MLTSGCGEFLRWTLVLAFLFCSSSLEEGDLRCPTAADDVFHGVVVDCTSKGLQPSDLPLLDIPVNNTTSLLLDYNSLRRIINGSFSRLQKLRRLQIHSSGIIYLELDAFEGLAGLQILSLYDNFLDIVRHAFPFGVFAHTPLLKELNIGHNFIKTGSGNYSDFIDIFDVLPKLCDLCITSFPTLYIGNEFEKLGRLERLDVHGGSVSIISNNSLEGLQHSKIKHFKLSHANPSVFGTRVFESLPHTISSLALFSSHVGNINLLSAMEPLHGRKIEVLYFNSVSFSMSLNSKVQIEDGIIGNENLKHLLNICVFNLMWKNSNLMAFDLRLNLNSTFGSCIQSLDMSGNNLQQYRLYFVLKLALLKVLEKFRLSRDWLPKHTVSFWDEKNENLLKTISPDNNQELGFQNDSTSVSLEKENKRNRLFLTDETIASRNRNPISCIRFPQHLRYISLDTARGLRVTKSDVKFAAPNNVTELYFRYATTSYKFQHLFLGLDNVRLLDFTGTWLEEIPLAFFDFFPGLQVLVLRHTQEDPGFFQLQGRRLIQNIANLVYLDLSDNGLSLLPHGIFQENRRLRYLCLAKNRFSTIPFQIRLTPSLQKLDLRMNAFSGLHKGDQVNIDEHITKHRRKNFTLFLEGNNLQCICSDLLFAAWIQRTNALFDPNGRLTCLGEHGNTLQIESFSDFGQMWRKCHGRYWILTSLLLLFAMLVLYLTVFLISMYRTYIIGKLKQMFVPEFQHKTRQDFTYDVFIGYANQDCAFIRFRLLRYLEGELKLTTFVHQRDLRQDNLDLCHALSDSWRTLLVITEAFLAHEMCDFIMKTAIFFESPSKQDSVVVMVTQDLLYSVPDYVLRVVKEENIIVLPDLETPLSYEATETLRTRILC